METYNLFSTPLAKGQIKEFDEKKDDLIKWCDEIRFGEAGDLAVSNQGGFHSAYMSDWSIPIYQSFRETILEACEGVAGDTKIDVAEFWVNINSKHNWNTPHTHMPYFLSGCMYVRTSGDASTGGVLNFLDPCLIGEPYRESLSAYVVPEPGDCFVFPGYLAHYVTPSVWSEDRISVAFNLVQVND